MGSLETASLGDEGRSTPRPMQRSLLTAYSQQNKPARSEKEPKIDVFASMHRLALLLPGSFLGMKLIDATSVCAMGGGDVCLAGEHVCSECTRSSLGRI